MTNAEEVYIQRYHDPAPVVALADAYRGSLLNPKAILLEARQRAESLHAQNILLRAIAYIDNSIFSYPEDERMSEIVMGILRPDGVTHDSVYTVHLYHCNPSPSFKRRFMELVRSLEQMRAAHAAEERSLPPCQS